MTFEGHDRTGRRRFFQEALGRAVKPLGDYLAKRFDLSSRQRPLRPPGALPEAEFLDTCLRCGSCVEACPAVAIFPTPSGDPDTVGTPMIDPDLAPCVVCEGLECMKACPSGALKLVEAPQLIRMGVARVDGRPCVRSSGEDCTTCLDRCPMGERALRISDGGPPIVLDGCVGCGVCQHYCPTSPRAIVVEPR